MGLLHPVSISESYSPNVSVSLCVSGLSLSFYHCIVWSSCLFSSICLSLCVTITESFCACLYVRLRVFQSLVSLCVSLCFPPLVPSPVLPCLLHLVPMASVPRPSARRQHRPAPALRWLSGTGPGSGFQTLPVPPRVLVPLLYLQPPRVFVSPALTRPLCLSPEAPAPPHPHLPLHIPWAARGS